MSSVIESVFFLHVNVVRKTLSGKFPPTWHQHFDSLWYRRWLSFLQQFQENLTGIFRNRQRQSITLSRHHSQRIYHKGTEFVEKNSWQFLTNFILHCQVINKAFLSSTTYASASHILQSFQKPSIKLISLIRSWNFFRSNRRHIQLNRRFAAN